MFCAYKIIVSFVHRKGSDMIKKIIFGVMAVMMIAFPAHAEIKVDIIANAAEPISVAV